METEQPSKRPYKAPIQSMVDQSMQDGTTGPLIGSLIIIAIMVIGGLYFWGAIVVGQKAQIQTQIIEQEHQSNAQIRAITSQSDSDETESIEADLTSTSFDDLDAELDALDAEYGQ